MFVCGAKVDKCVRYLQAGLSAVVLINSKSFLQHKLTLLSLAQVPIVEDNDLFNRQFSLPKYFITTKMLFLEILLYLWTGHTCTITWTMTESSITKCLHL